MKYFILASILFLALTQYASARSESIRFLQSTNTTDLCFPNSTFANGTPCSYKCYANSSDSANFTNCTYKCYSNWTDTAGANCSYKCYANGTDTANATNCTYQCFSNWTDSGNAPCSYKCFENKSDTANASCSYKCFSNWTDSANVSCSYKCFANLSDTAANTSCSYKCFSNWTDTSASACSYKCYANKTDTANLNCSYYCFSNSTDSANASCNYTCYSNNTDVNGNACTNSNTSTANTTSSYSVSVSAVVNTNSTTTRNVMVTIQCSQSSTQASFVSWIGNAQYSVNVSALSFGTSGAINQTSSSANGATEFTFIIEGTNLRNAGDNYTLAAFCKNASNFTSSVGYGAWNQPSNGGKSYVVYAYYNLTNTTVFNVSNATTTHNQAQSVYDTLSSYASFQASLVVDVYNTPAQKQVRMLADNTTTDNNTNSTNGTNTTDGTNTTNGTTTTNTTTSNVSYVVYALPTYILRDYYSISDTTSVIVSNLTNNQTWADTFYSKVATSQNLSNTTGLANITVQVVAVEFPAPTVSWTKYNSTDIIITIQSNVNGTYYIVATADQAFIDTNLTNTDVKNTVDQNGKTWPYRNTGSITTTSLNVDMYGLPSDAAKIWFYVVVEDNLPTKTLSFIQTLVGSTTSSNSGSFGEKFVYGVAMVFAVFLAILLN